MKYEMINNIEDYIDDIIKLDDEFYDSKYLWSNEYQYEVYKRNEDSFIAIKDGDILVGYLNYLCISETAYAIILDSDVTVDEYELDDIVKFNEGNNYLTINSVVIKKEYQDKDVIKIITDAFLSKLKELNNKGIVIEAICGTAVSDDGYKFFKNLGFNNNRLLDDGNRLFYMEDHVIDFIENSLNILKNK